MGTISSSIGLVSGINTADIIDQLMALEERPKTVLQARIKDTSEVKLAFVDLSTRLSGIRSSGSQLRRPSLFERATASSSNEGVLKATAQVGAAAGSYQFQVARLVSTQQAVTNGFADVDTAPVGAGTLTIEMGGGSLQQDVELNNLNNGEGVNRGTFRLTDRSGASTLVDLSDAVTVDDVIEKINSDIQVSVRAELDNGALKLTDLSGGTGDFRVQDLGTGTAAVDLGIAGTVSSSTITGGSLSGFGLNTKLADLNDGQGVRTAAAADFRITLDDGTTADVQLNGLETIGDVVNAIQTATSNKATVSISGNGLTITDTTVPTHPVTGNPTPNGTFALTALNSSAALQDLGLDGTASSTTLVGSAIVAAPGDTLISSLNGGQGFTLGTISVTNRTGGATDIDLSGETTVAGLIDTINAAGAGVTAQLNQSGNGIDLIDTTGGTGDLVIGDAAGTTATDFGWAGTYGVTEAGARGANLQRQWVHENTLLADLNAGNGISLGRIRITDASGSLKEIDFGVGTFNTVGDVINQINSQPGLGVTAAINDQGDGIVLTDTTGAGGSLKVEDVTGTFASDLRIAGSTATGEIDGSYEVTIDVTATDSLEDVQTKINDLSFAVRADILNDGSGATPYRLSLTGRDSGKHGAFIFDAGTTKLGARNLVEARDAAVFVGAGTTDEPLLFTSSSNTIRDAVPFVELELTGVSDQPVTVNVGEDIQPVIDELTGFVTKFNDLRDAIDEYTKFNESTNTRGLLLGEPSVQRAERVIYDIINARVEGSTEIRILADVGIRIDDGATLRFDEEKFRDAWAKDPEAVKDLFTQADTGIGFLLQDKVETLTDPVEGLIKQQTDRLDEQVALFEQRILELDERITFKRGRLEKQFLDMEIALSKLQYQQSALANFQPVPASQSSSNSSS